MAIDVILHSIQDIQGVRARTTFAHMIERAGKTINTKEEITKNVKPTAKGFVRPRTDHNFWNVKDINSG